METAIGVLEEFQQAADGNLAAQAIVAVKLFVLIVW